MPSPAEPQRVDKARPTQRFVAPLIIGGGVTAGVALLGCTFYEFISEEYVAGLSLLLCWALLGSIAKFVYGLVSRQRLALARADAEREQLRIPSVLLHNLLSYFPGGIYFKDAECRFLRVSQALANHLGMQREEDVWGKTDLDIFTSEHSEQAMRDEKEIMRTGRPMVDFEEKETFAGGREAWVSTSKIPLRRDGKIIGTFGISLDVTKRKIAERAAERERGFLHALMENIPDLIYFKDLDSRFTNVNRAHARELGLHGPEEAVGKRDSDFFPADFARKTRDAEQALMTSGKPLIGQLEHQTRGNRWFLATKVPIKDESGTVLGLVGISTDLTERKRIEEKLEQDLKVFLDVVSQAAAGDLTQRCTAGDDTLGRIGQSVNQMLGGFADILKGVRDVAGTVAGTSAEVLGAATQIAKGAQFANDQVHTTSTAAEELSMSMKEVSHHAEASAQAAQQVLTHLRKGRDSVNAAAHGMSNIDMTTTEMTGKMRLLEKRSQKIFDIIELIEDIAEQSTLLSLNAAIAAARAGEAGRGFGVVAEEIRHLADRSSESAKQVSVIVQGIVKDTKEVLTVIEKGAVEVHVGRDLSGRAEESLVAIQELVEQSVMLAEKISTASREQATTTETVSAAMQEISSVTRESSAGADETSNAIRKLVSLSEQLEQAIVHFKVQTS